MSVLILDGLLSSCHGSAGHDPKALVALGHQWVAAWNSHQSDKLLKLLDSDVIFWWPTIKVPVRGREETKKYIESLWSAWTGLELNENSILVDEHLGKVAVDWALAAKDVKTGNSIALDGVDVLRVRNGLISADRGIFDNCSLLTQLDARAPSGTPAGPAASKRLPGS